MVDDHPVAGMQQRLITGHLPLLDDADSSDESVKEYDHGAHRGASSAAFSQAGHQNASHALLLVEHFLLQPPCFTELSLSHMRTFSHPRVRTRTFTFTQSQTPRCLLSQA